MKVYLKHKGQRYVATPSGDHAIVSGLTCCGDTVRAMGRNMRVVGDRRYESDAVSQCCETPLGTLVVEPATLFGIAEDEAVLHGRCRVY